MSSIFELQARVRRLRDAISYLKKTTAADGDELGEALRTRADPKTCEEWETFIRELREYMTAAEKLAPRRKSATKAARPAFEARTAAVCAVSWPIDSRATIH